MAKSKSTVGPSNRLVSNCGAADTICNCMSVIEFMSQVDLNAFSDNLEFGRSQILMLVNDALDHAQSEIINKRVEVPHG